MASLTAVAARLRENPDILNMPEEDRRALLRLALLDTQFNPDDTKVIERLEGLLRTPDPVIPRFKAATGLPSRDIADMLSKSRPLIAAIVTGDRPEYLDDKERKILSDYLKARLNEMNHVLEMLG